MSNAKENISIFATRVKQLLLEHESALAEIASLKKEVEECKRHCAEMEMMVKLAEDDYANLKTAKIMEIGDGDLESTRKKINSMIRDITKCIDILSGTENADK